MASLKSYGKATAAILKNIIAPQIGRSELADAVGYIENAGAPSAVVPDFIGQMLFNTSTPSWYKAFGTAAGEWAAQGVGTLTAAELSILDGALVTTAELNRIADVSTRIVNCTASTLAVTEADHCDKTIVLDRAAGIAVTLPVASAGLKFRFVVKTTFTGAASIKSVAGADVMIGQALLGNNTDNAVVAWQALASGTIDTIDLFGTANSTGGIEGQLIEIEGLAANLWRVNITGDAAGTEATPFANTVA